MSVQFDSNNARAALSSALNDAMRTGVLLDNPCRYVPPLRVEHHELEYLRLAEIDPYLRACPHHYRPLAELLIGTGARISEALALTWPDIDLDHNSVQIQRQRARHGDSTRQTKGGNARSVLIGPRLTRSLRELHETRRPAGAPDWLFICPRPRRGRYGKRAATSPLSRRTVNEWHHHTLTTAGLRTMPLHALRHTAAASWLTTGHSLLFVAHQLGHRNITTTEEHYGHLEYSLLSNTLSATRQPRNRWIACRVASAGRRGCLGRCPGRSPRPSLASHVERVAAAVPAGVAIYVTGVRLRDLRVVQEQGETASARPGSDAEPARRRAGRRGATIRRPPSWSSIGAQS